MTDPQATSGNMAMEGPENKGFWLKQSAPTPNLLLQNYSPPKCQWGTNSELPGSILITQVNDGCSNCLTRNLKLAGVDHFPVPVAKLEDVNASVEIAEIDGSFRGNIVDLMNFFSEEVENL